MLCEAWTSVRKTDNSACFSATLHEKESTFAHLRISVRPQNFQPRTMFSNSFGVASSWNYRTTSDLRRSILDGNWTLTMRDVSLKLCRPGVATGSKASILWSHRYLRILTKSSLGNIWYSAMMARTLRSMEPEVGSQPLERRMNGLEQLARKILQVSWA